MKKNDDERYAYREQKAAAERLRLLEMDDNERDAYREQKATTERLRLMEMDDDEREAFRENKTAYMQYLREQLDEDIVEEIKEEDAKQHRRSRFLKNQALQEEHMLLREWDIDEWNKPDLMENTPTQRYKYY